MVQNLTFFLVCSSGSDPGCLPGAVPLSPPPPASINVNSIVYVNSWRAAITRRASRGHGRVGSIHDLRLLRDPETRDPDLGQGCGLRPGHRPVHRLARAVEDLRGRQRDHGRLRAAHQEPTSKRIKMLSVCFVCLFVCL